MGKRANAKMIGLFVLGAAALAVLAVMIVGSGRLFRKTHEYALLFRGNVNGLRVGGAVKFKGVQIGSVTRILISINPAPTLEPSSAGLVKIPVIIELEQGRLVSHGAAQINLDDPRTMKQMIDLGLRGQLAVESYVTGILYVDLDMHPGSPATLSLPPGAPYQEIPTLPTPLEQAQSALTQLIAQLNEVNFKKLVASTSETLEAIQKLVTSPELKTAVANVGLTTSSLNQTAISIRQLALKMDKQIGPLTRSLRASSQSADAALIQARSTLSNAETILDQDSPLIYQTDQTLEDLSSAARSMRQLADYLQRNPGAAVRGRYYGIAR